MRKLGPKKWIDIPAIEWHDSDGNFWVMKDKQLGIDYRMRKKSK